VSDCTHQETIRVILRIDKQQGGKILPGQTYTITGIWPVYPAEYYRKNVTMAGRLPNPGSRPAIHSSISTRTCCRKIRQQVKWSPST